MVNYSMHSYKAINRVSPAWLRAIIAASFSACASITSPQNFLGTGLIASRRSECVRRDLCTPKLRQRDAPAVDLRNELYA